MEIRILTHSNMSGINYEHDSASSDDDESIVDTTTGQDDDHPTGAAAAAAAQDSKRSATGSSSSRGGDAERSRRAKRLAMNRASARARRQKKKVLIDRLEHQVSELAVRNQNNVVMNQSLSARILQLEAELAIAKATITTLQGQLSDMKNKAHLHTELQPQRRAFSLDSSFFSGIPGQNFPLGQSLQCLVRESGVAFPSSSMMPNTMPAAAPQQQLALGDPGSSLADQKRHVEQLLSRHAFLRASGNYNDTMATAPPASLSQLGSKLQTTTTAATTTVGNANEPSFPNVAFQNSPLLNPNLRIGPGPSNNDMSRFALAGGTVPTFDFPVQQQQQQQQLQSNVSSSGAAAGGSRIDPLSLLSTREILEALEQARSRRGGN